MVKLQTEFDSALSPATTDATNLNCLTGLTWAVHWQSLLTENLLRQLLADGWIYFDAVFDKEALRALQVESGYVTYRDATLTDGERVPEIRGDRIRWIAHPNKPTLPVGNLYLQCVEELGQVLNRLFFCGIKRCEAHYACYPKGFGYDWHTDNPQGRDERVMSAVYYLNDDWTAQDGGALELIDNQGRSQTVLPKANRLVLFDSNLRHRVQIAYRERYSIATWLRRDDAHFVI